MTLIFLCSSILVLRTHYSLSQQMILPISVEDVKWEVKILQQLTGHENVVQFHDAFERHTVLRQCFPSNLLHMDLVLESRFYAATLRPKMAQGCQEEAQDWAINWSFPIHNSRCQSKCISCTSDASVQDFREHNNNIHNSNSNHQFCPKGRTEMTSLSRRRNRRTSVVLLTLTG